MGELDHHAYLLIGSREAGEQFVSELLEREGIMRANNPDIHFFREATLGIDEARSVRMRAERKSFGNKAIFVILAERINREAQNALLKTLEEPPLGTHFFVVAAHEELLLSTLRSRMQIRKLTSPPLAARESTPLLSKERGKGRGVSDKLSPESFLELTPVKRIAFAKKFVDAEKPLGPFLDQLLSIQKESASVDVLKKIFTLRRYVDDPSASGRMILEHLAFVV
jgi:DNA polymerase III, delta subunit